MGGPLAATLPEMTAAEKDLWNDFIHRDCGLSFTGRRASILHKALAARVARRRLSSTSAYYHFVAYAAEGPREWAELREELVNTDTRFFRHSPSFDLLASTVLPQRKEARRQQGSQEIRLWSAGCSTGQEAYSLAMCFALTEADPTWQLQVLGSDLSERALSVARRGQYRAADVAALDESIQRRCFRPSAEGWREVHAPLRERVEFRRFNLCDPASWAVASQDVIFCQNVLIYFHPHDRLAILRRLAEHLAPGGYLFLSPSEAMGLWPVELTPVSCAAAVYQRPADGSPSGQ